MPIEVPASITSLKDLIALNLDLAQETIIDNLESPLTEVFNVVILTGEPHSSANMNMGTAYGNPTDSEGTPAAPVYFFARVRRLDVDSLEKPDPFKAATYRSRRRLTNLHPLAVAINSGGESVMPTQGDIWEARYLNRFRKGLILNKKVGRSQEYESLIISGKAEGVLYKAIGNNAEGNTVGDYAPAKTVPAATSPAPKRRTYVGTNSNYKNKVIENGRVPAELLQTTVFNIHTDEKGKAVMVKEAMPDFKRLANAYFSHFGRKITINSSYRTYQRQIDLRKEQPNFSATPGTSNHGWGFAFDFQNTDENGNWIANGTEKAKKWNPEGYKYGGAGYRSPTYKWMMENAPKYNFVNPPALQEGGGGSDEPWHFQWIDSKMETVVKQSAVILTGEE